MKFYRAVGYTILNVPVIYAIAVLWGAPLLSHFGANLFFSVILSIISVFPLLLVAENIEHLDSILFDERQLSRKCAVARRISLGGVIGAWFGAFVIPLDWDRWWQYFLQRWPLPCILGALLGGTVGSVISSSKIIFAWLKGQRKLEKIV